MTPPPLRGPAFGSYPAEDVAWLLTDLSDVELEAPAEEREEAIQAGDAHYAESLPIEFLPSPAYQQLFLETLATTAPRLAHAVGVVTELLLRRRGERLVLASLARAGTPVGVLLRRWAAYRHGLDLPHYSLSIVRDRGIDQLALRHLAEHHDPADVAFVDGWTGKGAITRELAASVAQANASLGIRFDSDLAVLADTGHCVGTFGTRDDFLIPSACLNSTVSGLVSRTVLNRELIGPGDYHGAKHYRHLADADVSGLFCEAVALEFETVTDRVDADVAALGATDRAPTWAGWAAVESLRAAYGIHDVNLVKPGVGETTRVLLRRVPWQVLVRDAGHPDVRHILMLAAERDVPVAEVADLPFAAVGLIRPSTAGAGDHGTAALGRTRT